jgi:hypothetical protein
MADLTAQTIPVPYDGIDADSSPDLIPDTKAPIVENFLTDQPGKLVMRGPFVLIDANPLVTTPGSQIVGTWRFNDTILFGSRGISATAVRDPWVAPYRKAATAPVLSGDGLLETYVDLFSLVTNARNPLADQNPSHSHAHIGPYVYGPSFSPSTAAILVDGGYQFLNPIIRWDGSILGVPIVYANAPKGSQGVIAHYQRLLAFGGRNPDGTGTIQANTMWWSDLLAGTTALPDTVAAWSDDVSGLVNQIVVDADGGDFLVAAAKVGQNLAIFKRHSIHLLLGYSPSTWTVKTFTLEQGCIDPRSIVQYEDGCFFMSDRGFMYFDGAQLVNVSQGLRSTLVEAAIAAVGDAGVDGGYVTAGCLPNGYIMVCAGNAPSTSASATLRTTTFAGIYHVPRRAWTTITNTLTADGGTAPYCAGRTLTQNYALDARSVWSAKAVTAPERVAAANRGFDHGATDAAILSKFTTKLFRLAGPLNAAQLHRFIIDYNWKRSGVDQAITATGTAWKVTLANAAGTALQTAHRVRASSDGATSYTYRRRNVVEVMQETNELQVTVEATAPAVAITRAEVLMAYVEFQGTQLRRTE